MVLRAADTAWIALGVGVLTYDLAAKPGQTLSEGADRYMLTHPWITRVVAFALAAHVCNLVKPEYDLIHLGFRAIREAQWTSAVSHLKSTPG